MIRQNVQLERVGVRLQAPSGGRSGWPNWPRIAPVAATAWSLAYAALCVFWALGGPGYPYWSGADHQGPSLSILGDLPPSTVSPIAAAWGLIGAAAAVLMARRVSQRAVRVFLLLFAGVTSVTLTLVIPDYRLLVFVA